MKNNVMRNKRSGCLKFAIFVLVIMALLMSCATQRRCLEKFPPVTTVEIRDSVSYRDTTIFVIIPADTIRDSIEIIAPCPENKPIRPEYKSKPITVIGRWSSSTAWIERGRLKLNLMVNDTTLKFVIDSAVAERMKEITINQQFVEPVKYVPKIYKIALIVSIVIIILIIVKIILNLTR